MNNGSKAANAVGGKTARACDSCVRKRARWYCAADDAFLCQGCETSVHTANHLARQHQRVRLGTTSLKPLDSGGSLEPNWPQGFTRRARTPRTRTKSSHKIQVQNSSIPLVPEMGILDMSLLDDDEDEQLLYRVPVFDPFAAELCNASNDIEGKGRFVVEEILQQETCNLDDLQGFDLPTDDLELQEFAADVESLLGKGLDDDLCGIEGLGLTIDCKNEEDNANNIDIFIEKNRVKVEQDEVEAVLGCDLDTTGETIGWDFDYESTMLIRDKPLGKKSGSGVNEERKIMVMRTTDECEKDEGMKMRRSGIVLRLNYEEVIKAWADQRSPWTTGTRPDVNSGECWPDFMGVHRNANNPCYGGSSGGREARVSRYREKRRTRLFSKKIRYEVRKLNAEKRPRMKGRFVKRESFRETTPASFNFHPFSLTNK